MPSLKISPIAYRPSNLSIPASPFSPLSPLTPKSFAPYKQVANFVKRASISPTTPPASPLKWLWQCHSCRSTYPLGATRRCLEDGHHFCAGTTIVRVNKREGVGSKKVVKRHRACASEFDYQAWQSWGDWKRANFRASPVSVQPGKDCWNHCNYPSECRWGAQQTPPATSPPATTFDSIMKKAGRKEEAKKEKEKKTHLPNQEVKPTKEPDFWAMLLASATRRKSPKSPLILSTVVEDAEGDVEMLDVPVISEPEPSLQMPKLDSDGSSEVEDLMLHTVSSEMKKSARRGRD